MESLSTVIYVSNEGAIRIQAVWAVQVQDVMAQTRKRRNPFAIYLGGT
jgi:hypothetical protein